MKKWILSFFAILFGLIMQAQNYPFDAKWKDVDTRFEQGQLKSIQPLLEEIFDAAQRSNRSPDKLKASILLGQIAIATVDSADITLITRDRFQDHLNNAKQAEKSLWHTYLAVFYHDYYQNNQWRINDRTNLAAASNSDFRAWSTKSFIDTIDYHLQQALSWQTALKSESIDKWKLILSEGKDFKGLEPTLLDVVGGKVLQIYQSNLFQRQEFAESLRNERVLSIYDMLIDASNKHSNNTIRVYHQLNKIKYLYREDFTNPDYLNELQQLYQANQKNKWASSILYEMAVFHTQDALQPEEKNNVQALDFCSKAIENFSGTLGADQCVNLNAQITLPELNVSTDKNLYADAANPLYISHTNVNTLYLKIYKLLTVDLARADSGYEFDEKRNVYKVSGNLVHEKSISLQEFKDYKTHTTKDILQILPAGNYVMLASNNSKFERSDKNIVSATDFVVSAYEVNFRHETQENRTLQNVQLANKDNGLPVNSTIELHSSLSNEPWTIIDRKTPDELGRIAWNVDRRDYRRRYAIKIPNENTLHLANLYSFNSPRGDTRHQSIAFFTDRAIYRPAQMVYFKAILYTQDNKEVTIARNQPVEISLNDVNGVNISKLQLRSNEFGSVQGEFVLPSSGLTGTFSLQDNWGNSYHPINVEEYKRPTFQVKIDSLQQSYQLNDTVHISGIAQSFSGVNISDAHVAYRVVRQAYNPWRPWWRPYVHEPEVEITQGVAKTNAEGKFDIEFAALPAKRRIKDAPRAYIYSVIADVTDVAGETRSANHKIRIGDLPFSLQLTHKEIVNVQQNDTIEIKVQNLDGTLVSAPFRLEIYKLQSPNRILRDKQKSVDYELKNAGVWYSTIPYIAYNNDHLPENWNRGQKFADQQYTNDSEVKFSIPNSLQPGDYEIYVVAEHNGEKIERKSWFTVTDTQTSSAQIFWKSELKKGSVEPGSKAEIEILSNAQSANVLLEVEHDGTIIERKILPIKDGKANYQIPVIESHRGGLFIHTYFSKYNQIVSKVHNVVVPFTNKELEISTANIRSTLEPGSENIWELNIKDKYGKVLPTELLASMYDKSLDAFLPHEWQWTLYNQNYSRFQTWSGNEDANIFIRGRFRPKSISLNLADLNTFGFSFDEFNRQYMLNESIVVRGMASVRQRNAPAPTAVQDDVAVDLQGQVAGVSVQKSQVGYDAMPVEDQDGAAESVQIPTDAPETIVARRNLQETAFFFPQILAEKDGSFKLRFTTPDALTTWKLMVLGHTQDLKIGQFSQEVISQKKLMIQPNAPRFLREGDELQLQARISNLSEQQLSGTASLMFFDPFTMQPIDADFSVNQKDLPFSVDKDGNTSVSWNVKIPFKHQVVVYRVVAQAGDYTDGEENTLPILTNRTMVTETMPIHIREGQNKVFNFQKLQTQSDTRQDFKLTLEFTANPLWHAIMALPYLREFPYECSEQIFARLYGNLISQHIVNSNPKIKAVFDDWNRKGELISPLEKNQELKNILLEETPWVREAQSETEQMKRIAVLFDINTMRNELPNTFIKLQSKLAENGGFPWFEGGRPNFYVTNHIVAGFGKLKKMQILESDNLDIDTDDLVHRAISFIDREIKEEWRKHKVNPKEYSFSITNGTAWLYARSMYLDEVPLDKTAQEIRNHVLDAIEKDKFQQHLRSQALSLLVLHRYGKTQSAQQLLSAVFDRATDSDEMGMYWKENVSGRGWYEAPVETQALIIEATDEIQPQSENIESMKVWLLKNKQTNRWHSTKATTEAVYVLMNTGKSWVGAEEGVSVKVGGASWPPADAEKQSGSGYVKTSWSATEITPAMGTVEVSKTSPGVAWGAMYWQYFEDLDKITSAETNVRFRKELFIQRNTDQGPQLTALSSANQIVIGDLVKVRLEIQTDRALEFVHIKDMRASGFEPINVLSGFRWQDGLGYYKSTRDAATNFFIDYLPKGVYVFEYDLRANNAGEFSNGITTLQNMYAPEFSAHSKGIRLQIQNPAN
ncbi:MAG: alpha-2-macroglobulin family protein [Weeksellaceae bacterium]|nr:alpha-2-macroglobulin family protein [Weeksellaceae bacterium]